MIGRVHSIESFGTVDGPGIRMVIFLSGCPMRCLYCHNPDTWDPKGGTPMTVEQLLNQYDNARHFYRKGGITVSGGEPLTQIGFVTELFEEAKKRGIHTCLDTSGVTFRPDSAGVREKFDRLAAVTDLVLLDIKHIDPQEHLKLCGQLRTTFWRSPAIWNRSRFRSGSAMWWFRESRTAKITSTASGCIWAR